MDIYILHYDTLCMNIMAHYTMQSYCNDVKYQRNICYKFLDKSTSFYSTIFSFSTCQTYLAAGTPPGEIIRANCTKKILFVRIKSNKLQHLQCGRCWKVKKKSCFCQLQQKFLFCSENLIKLFSNHIHIYLHICISIYAEQSSVENFQGGGGEDTSISRLIMASSRKP